MTVVEAGLTHIGDSLGTVLKEVRRRIELRSRLETEMGRPLADSEFLEIAERTGLKI